MKSVHQHSTGSRKSAGKLKNYLASHLTVLFETSASLIASPVSSLMTIFVISIALLLPVLLQVVGINLAQINDQFEETAQITLYLYENVTEDQALEISEGLLQNPDMRRFDARRLRRCLDAVRRTDEALKGGVALSPALAIEQLVLAVCA